MPEILDVCIISKGLYAWLIDPTQVTSIFSSFRTIHNTRIQEGGSKSNMQRTASLLHFIKYNLGNQGSAIQLAKET